MAVARASVNVMKCGVRVRQGTHRHVFDAVASRHPQRRHLRGVDNVDNDIDDDDDDDMRLPMQLPLTLRICCLQRRELRGGGGGLSVRLGLGVDDDDDDNDDDTRLPMQLPLMLRRRHLQRRELRGGGGGLSVVAAVTSENVCQRR